MIVQYYSFTWYILCNHSCLDPPLNENYSLCSLPLQLDILVLGSCLYIAIHHLCPGKTFEMKWHLNWWVKCIASYSSQNFHPNVLYVQNDRRCCHVTILILIFLFSRKSEIEWIELEINSIIYFGNILWAKYIDISFGHSCGLSRDTTLVLYNYTLHSSRLTHLFF